MAVRTDSPSLSEPISVSVASDAEKKDVFIRIVDELPDYPETSLLYFHKAQMCLALWDGERWVFFPGLT